jgi:hypothetical protein
MTIDEKLLLNIGAIEGIKPTNDGNKRRYLARFARSGQVRAAGNRQGSLVIEPDALSGAVAAGLFDGKAVFLDHAEFFQYPSVTRLAGVTQAAGYADGVVSGQIELLDTPAGRVAAELLDEILALGTAGPDVGLSMVIYPLWQSGVGDASEQGLRRVVEIKHVESVDLVFEPAADGRILAALSAARQLNGRGEASAEWIDCPQSSPSRCFALSKHDSMNWRKNMEAIQEQARTIDLPGAAGSAIPAQLEQLPAPPRQVSAGEQVAEAAQTQTWLEAVRLDAARAMIANSSLPTASQAHLSARQYSNPQEVTEAINAERAYLARLTADSVIQIGGQAPRSGQVGGMLTSLDKVQVALDALMLGTRPENGIQPLSGIREAYHLLSGDYEMNGVFQPDRLTLANVTSSTMAALVANALNKRLAIEFQEYPQWWLPIVTMEDFDSLQDVRWITLGGVGELPTVAEGAAYTEMTWDDKTETSAFVKKGGYLGLTIEAIDKDDVGRIRAAPRALAQAAWLTLSKAVSYIFTETSGTGPLVADGTRLFTTGHGNLGTTALSITELAAVRLAMRKQTELNSGERLGALTAPKFLLVPPDLEITALQVLASDYDYLYALSNGTAGRTNVFAEGNDLQARMAFAKSRVIVVDLWTDTNDWAAVADPRLYPTIGLGFRYGRVPEIFSVASPTAGLMFTNDTMPIKVRFFFATGPMDYRGLYKENV